MARLCQELKTTFDSDLSDDLPSRDRKEYMKHLCLTDLRDKRDHICEKLESKGTYVLRNEEIEDYVGVGKRSKGKYLDTAKRIVAGELTINYQDDLFGLYERALGLD